jgi:hypothetical protein
MKIKKVLYLKQLEIGCFVAKQYQLRATKPVNDPAYRTGASRQ